MIINSRRELACVRAEREFLKSRNSGTSGAFYTESRTGVEWDTLVVKFILSY